MSAMNSDRILLDYTGTYGGRASRDEILRALKEALALVEQTPGEAQLSCAGLRIELLDAGGAAPAQDQGVAP
ncbi:MAG: hypothetical protein H6648_00660 [Caldilineae bacterium]|nr:hypothetical protein [Chloroflexota bacterium]MCB9175639.1 hypothetical protein [Caldilineae bacterium]